MWMMLVHTPFMKSWECETSRRMRENLASVSSSHTHASRSRWLVGSSRTSRHGSTNSARARAMRMRQPPEKSRVFLACMVLVKPRPCRIWPARAAAVSASSLSSRS